MTTSAFPMKCLAEVLEFSNGKAIVASDSGDVPVFGSNGVIGRAHKALGSNAIILGRVGAYCGSTEYCPGQFWATDNTIISKPHDAAGSIRFYFYLLKNMNLNRWAGGSAQPLLTQITLKALAAPIPPIAAQRRIVEILSAYDDLIENNERRIRILEEMARTIYREWFVEFRFPGHERVRMVESEVGKIPEGWSALPLDHLIVKHIGGGWGKESAAEGYSRRAYVIRGTDIPGARYLDVRNCPLRFHRQSNLESRVLAEGDLVVEVSGGSKDQSVGRVLLVSRDLVDSFEFPVMCASFCKRLQVDKRVTDTAMLYCALLNIYDGGDIARYEVQSTGIKNLNFKTMINSEMIVLPTSDIRSMFEAQWSAAFGKVQMLSRQNQNLRKTRDLLLPKLLSGTLNLNSINP